MTNVFFGNYYKTFKLTVTLSVCLVGDKGVERGAMDKIGFVLYNKNRKETCKKKVHFDCS